MSEIAKLYATIGGDTRGLDSALGRAKSGLSGIGAAGVAAGNLIASGVTMGIGAVAGLGKAALDTAMDYQSAMNMFGAVSGATADQMKRAGEVAKAMGADMSLPGTSAGDAAEAMTELAKAGLSVEDTFAAIKGTLQMSAAGQLSNAEAAAIAANALNSFGLAGTEANRVADLLAATANATSADVTDIAQALQQVSAVAKSSNVSIEDTVAALGQMANAGIKGSDAGTSLKAMLIALQAPTSTAEGVLTSLGLSAYDAAGKMKPLPQLIQEFSTRLGENAPGIALNASELAKLEGAAATGQAAIESLTGKLAAQQIKLSELQTELSNATTKYGASSEQVRAKQTAVDNLTAAMGANQTKISEAQASISAYKDAAEISAQKTAVMTEEQRNFALKTIFGTDALRAANIVMMGGAESFDKMSTAVNKAGAAQDLAAAQTAGLKGAFDGLKSQLETLFIQLMDSPIMKPLEDSIRAVADFMGSAEVMGAISGLGAAIGQFLGDAVAWVKANWPTIKETVGNVFNAVKGFVDTVFAPAVGTVSEKAGGVVSWITTNWPTIQATVGNVFNAVKGFVETVLVPAVTAIVTAVSGVVSWITTNWPQIQTTIGAVFNAIKSVYDSVLAPVLNLIIGIAGTVVGWVRDNWPLISQTFETVGNAIKAKIDVVWPQIQAIIEGVMGAIKTVIDTVWPIIKGVVETTINTILGVIKTVMQIINGDWQGAWTTIQTTVATVWTTIKSLIEYVLNVIKTVLQNAWMSIKKAVETAWQSISDTIHNVWKGIEDFFATIPEKVANVGRGIVEGIANGIRGAADSVLSALSGVVNGAIDNVKRTLGIQSPSKVFAGFGKNMMIGMAQGIRDYGDLPQVMLRGVVAGATGAASGGGQTIHNWTFAPSYGSAPASSAANDFLLMQAMAGQA